MIKLYINFRDCLNLKLKLLQFKIEILQEKIKIDYE